MSLPVFVADLSEAEIGQAVAVVGAEAHHASAVRRIRVAELVVLTDTRGRRATGKVLVAERDVVRILVSGMEDVPRATPEITVVQAIPKGDRADLAVQMLTEIGVDTIIPWQAERSVAVWKPERVAKALGKWKRTAFESSKQARRSHFAEIRDLASTEEVADLVATADLGVVLHEEAAASLTGRSLPLSGRVVVVVGPEGGISAKEIDILGSEHCVRLGDTVLRTSTAGVAAVAALLAKSQRWGTTAGHNFE